MVAEDLVVDDDRTAAWRPNRRRRAARCRDRLRRRAPRRRRSSRARGERAPVAVGQRVRKWLAQVERADPLVPRRAAAVHPDGCVDINYDDGDFEGRVPPRFVRVVDEATVDRAAAAAASLSAGTASRSSVRIGADYQVAIPPMVRAAAGGESPASTRWRR